MFIEVTDTLSSTIINSENNERTFHDIKYLINVKNIIKITETRGFVTLQVNEIDDILSICLKEDYQQIKQLIKEATTIT